LQYSHQLTLFVDIGQVHHPARLLLPLLRRVVGQLCEGFSLGDTDTHGEMRPSPYRFAYLPAKIGQVTTVTHASQVAKGFIDTVNFAPRQKLL
jgi:hypothetical protein